MPNTATIDIPSFTKQTEYPSGYFGFGLMEKKGVDYFNCGLVRRPDGLWLMARRSKWQQGLKFGMNDVVAFLLNGHTPAKGVPVQLTKRWPDEQHEDPRCIYHNGRSWLSCCDFVWTAQGWTGAHQIMCEVSNDWHELVRYDPVYGNNGDNLGRNIGHEKNWIWFFHEDIPYLIYKANPHVVAQFSDKFQFVNEFITENPLPWKYGEIRGGTPPLRIGNEYWTFFHSSTDWFNPIRNRMSRRYHMGAYAFEAQPPFRITQMTNEPIISGSQEDRWAPPKPLVIFPCGTDYRDNKWFVSMGINDLACGWIEIPHNDILERCFKKKKFNLGTWLTDKITARTCGVIAYLPPPGIGHTDIFLKNMEDYPPSCPVHYISDYDWIGSHAIPSPKYHTSDKIASYVFLEALESAEKLGWTEFIYLETDCRVYGKDWDKVLRKAFSSGKYDSIAGGNLAIFGYDRSDVDFRMACDRLVKQYGYRHGGQPGVKTQILLQGLKTDKTIAFVNGAPAIYSVKSLRKILGDGSVESIVDRMKNNDLSIGEIAGDNSSASNTLRRYIHIPQVMATAGETTYPFHIRKEALESGEVVAVHPVKNRWRPPPPNGAVFYHSGDLGDIVYALKTIQIYGGGTLVLGNKCYSKCPPRAPMTQAVFDLFQPLLKDQPYLKDVRFSPNWTDCTYNLNEFREFWNNRAAMGIKIDSLCEAHTYMAGVESMFNPDPWLVCDRKQVARIVVHRSFRYREDDFPWKALVDQYQKEMCFVGLPDEYEDFTRSFGKVAYYQTMDFYNLACIINGAQWMIANQSFPCSIAIGLGKGIVQETWRKSPDCIFDRANFYTQQAFKQRKERL